MVCQITRDSVFVAPRCLYSQSVNPCLWHAATLQQLGQYYQKNGARSRMPQETGNSLLSKLKAADASLPPAPKKKGLFG